jgi:hypothetical protein
LIEFRLPRRLLLACSSTLGVASSGVGVGCGLLRSSPSQVAGKYADHVPTGSAAPAHLPALHQVSLDEVPGGELGAHGGIDSRSADHPERLDVALRHELVAGPKPPSETDSIGTGLYPKASDRAPEQNREHGKQPTDNSYNDDHPSDCSVDRAPVLGPTARRACLDRALLGGRPSAIRLRADASPGRAPD